MKRCRMVNTGLPEPDGPSVTCSSAGNACLMRKAPDESNRPLLSRPCRGIRSRTVPHDAKNFSGIRFSC